MPFHCRFCRSWVTAVAECCACSSEFCLSCYPKHRCPEVHCPVNGTRLVNSRAALLRSNWCAVKRGQLKMPCFAECEVEEMAQSLRGWPAPTTLPDEDH